MRIACVSLSQVPASTANSIQTLKACHALALGGAEVRLWVPGEPVELSPERLAEYYGLNLSEGTRPLELRWLASRRGLHRLDFTAAALQAARRWNADAIYTWLIQTAVLGLALGLPVVYEMHDRPTGRFGPTWLRLFARMRGRKRVLMITYALREKVAAEFGVHFPDEVVQIAPNAVEFERYVSLPEPAEARRQLGLPQQPTAVYTGHFYAGRGMDVLWSLAQAFPQVSFVWVGGRPADVEQWQAKVKVAGLKNITLTGFVENQRLPLYQAAGDVLLMPYERMIAGSSGGNSADICSPMKMFEYLAAGRAILSSDLPVIGEVLNPRNAVLAPPEDAQAWVRALDELLADGGQRRRLAAQAQKDAAAYSWTARAAPTLAWLQG